MPAKQYIDVAVIVPLEEEVNVVLETFPVLEDCSTDFAFWSKVDPGRPDLSVLVALQEKEGRTFASKAVTDVLAAYDVGLIVCLGIAGCLSNDLKLGDVIYTGDVADVLDNAKASDNDGQLELAFSPQPYETPRHITHAMNMVRMVGHLKPAYKDWQKTRGEFARSLISQPIPGRNGRQEKVGEPNTKNGKVVCADVSKSSIYNIAVKAADRKFLAIETEAGGIFAIAKHNNVPALAIRGLSDHADDNKNILEENTGGLVRTIAAGNAATFLRLQFQNDRFSAVLSARRSSSSANEGHSSAQTELPLDDLQSIINDAQGLVAERLGESSLGIRYKEPGYRLPVPRVRLVPEVGAIEVAPSSDDIEITDAVANSTVMMLTVPRAYPDTSLPFIVADAILARATHPTQLIPLVVDGANLRLPSRGLSSVEEKNLISRSRANQSCKCLIVLEHMPIRTQAHLNLFLKEIDSYKDCAFLFICREDDNAVLQSELKARVGADQYHLCDISFMELAWFVQNTFALNEPEAEVVAIKLQRTFDRYNLSAHPSYFAGIPKQILFKLLEASGRAELIALAVEGILLLLVSEDKAKVRISKSRREDFLSMLVVRMHVHKEIFSQADVVSLAKDNARKYAYEIDALNFVNDFVDTGILSFVGDKVVFSLPYLERYLLARKLSEDEALALTYFDMNDDKFDFATFDLYCEIGPSKRLTDLVCALVADTGDAHPIQDGHFLLGKQLQPQSLTQKPTPSEPVA